MNADSDSVIASPFDFAQGRLRAAISLPNRGGHRGTRRIEGKRVRRREGKNFIPHSEFRIRPLRAAPAFGIVSSRDTLLAKARETVIPAPTGRTVVRPKLA